MYSSDDFQQETETSHSHTYIGTGQASIMPRLCRTRMSLYPQIVGSEKTEEFAHYYCLLSSERCLNDVGH